MPSYKYQCKKCNEIFEYECKMSEYKATQKCDKCGTECERAVNDLDK